MEICKLGVSVEDAAKIVRGVAEGKYSLLTGAGFSLGSQCSHPGQETAPTSLELAKLLAKQFSLTMIPQSAADLPSAYEDAVFKVKDATKVYAYLRSVLTGLQPTWHQSVAAFAWRRLWTLNIDDLPQSIWRDASKKLKSFHFKDGYQPVPHLENEIHVVYLHGRLTHGGKPSNEQLVFSLPEYVEATRSPGSWHEAFFAEFSDQPFILCGASAVGEVDLSRAIRSGNQSRISRDMPSLAVVYRADEAAKERFRDRLGLIPIDCPGETFFAALKVDVDEYLEKNPPSIAPGASLNDARILGAQFQLLTNQRSPPKSRMQRHDFYAGDEPKWEDIQNNLDAYTQNSKRTVSYIERCWSDGQIPVVIITGAAGCGKSTSLLRVLRECSSFSDLTYIFRNDEGIDVGAIARCMPTTSKIVLGFDMAADYSFEIGELATELIKRESKFAIVAVDRSTRSRAMRNDLRRTIPHTTDASRFSSNDAGSLYQRRKAKHRLGSFTESTESAFRKFVVNMHDGNVFSAMAALEGGTGRGFEQRLNEFVNNSINSENILLLAHAVSLSHRWGYPLPVRNASIASRIDPVTLGELCSDSGELSDIFTINPKGLAFRHRVLASHFFDQRKDYSLRQSVLVELISSLAPLVTTSAIRAKTYTHLVCRAITRRGAVLDAVGDVHSARQVYSDVETAFGHNSRFWEQRALLESQANDHPKAYSYAKEAVSRENHAFPYTTLGRVCMAQAVSLGVSQPRNAIERFQEGKAALLHARAIARRTELVAHPFTAFFTYAEQFLPISRLVPEGERNLKDDWNDWIQQARRDSIFDDDTLQALDHKWFKACTAA
ncbi:hypothetical protein [Stenotrophomonas sp. JAG2]|uniref:P-loop NTPase n=1 Tax=Stenotrophomonas sp. JAG2 TaxID=3229243 RepID=UPI0034E19878